MKRVMTHRISRLSPQHGLTIPCELPTLAEAAERFQKTGEFILSAREASPDDFDADDTEKALMGNIPQYVDKIEMMLNEKDVNNMLHLSFVQI